MDEDLYALYLFSRLNDDQKALVGSAVLCFLLIMAVVGLYLMFTDWRKKS